MVLHVDFYFYVGFEYFILIANIVEFGTIETQSYKSIITNITHNNVD